MSDINHAIREFREMDELSTGTSKVHRLHPLAKLITTIVYIVVTASFHKYHFSGILVMILYPCLMFAISGLEMKKCFYKLRFMLPLVLAVGIFNPVFDRKPYMTIGSVVLSYGVLSMITLMLKGIFCLMAAYLLVATTSIDGICAALRKLHVPGLFVTLILLTYRYVTVMMNEVAIMTEAYKLRAPGQKGIQFSSWGSFLGQLLLRSMDKAQELYSSMQLRGFQGEFWYADVKKAEWKDYLFCILSVFSFLICREINISVLIGSFFVK